MFLKQILSILILTGKKKKKSFSKEMHLQQIEINNFLLRTIEIQLTVLRLLSAR